MSLLKYTGQLQARSMPTHNLTDTLIFYAREFLEMENILRFYTLIAMISAKKELFLLQEKSRHKIPIKDQQYATKT